LKEKSYPLVHCDAIQATNYFKNINVERLGVDLMSLSGSKIYGPKSSGVLYIRNKNLVSPVLHGGDQEFGLRAGTEDVAQIVGFTKALEITQDISEQESARLLELQNYFFAELEKNLTDYRVNGATFSLKEKVPEGRMRVCNNINISISGVSSERLVIELDAKGIAASSQSACRADSDEESYVIAALGRAKTNATEGSIRFTMGRNTTKKDVEKTVKILVENL
jgi:cysteine desulfurase